MGPTRAKRSSYAQPAFTNCSVNLRVSLNESHRAFSTDMYYVLQTHTLTAYLLQDAIDGSLVHLAGDGVLTQPSCHRAQVIQRGHSQCHLSLLVAELMHLDKASHEGLDARGLEPESQKFSEGQTQLAAGGSVMETLSVLYPITRSVRGVAHQQSAKQTQEKFCRRPLWLVDRRQQVLYKVLEQRSVVLLSLLAATPGE